MIQIFQEWMFILFVDREELRQEWVTKQEKIKNEEIDITYSYWDGSGHRRQVSSVVKLVLSSSEVCIFNIRSHFCFS